MTSPSLVPSLPHHVYIHGKRLHVYTCPQSCNDYIVSAYSNRVLSKAEVVGGHSATDECVASV